MFSTSYIELSKSALQQNLDFVNGFLQDNCRYSSVIKGNAYGHKIELFVPLAEACGVNHFSVFSADEALRTQKVCRPDTEIMIMGMLGNDEIEWAIEHDIAFFVFDFDRLFHALQSAKKLDKKARVHIEIETGMHRTGFEPDSLYEVIRTLQNEGEHLLFEGLCTHYSGAESISNYLRIKKQIIQFHKLKKMFTREGLSPVYCHTACSAAAMRYYASQMDMARIGIVQYGFFPSREVLIEYFTHQREHEETPTRRVLSWKSKVMDVKHVPKGEFIGYGMEYQANDDMAVASIPVGYSHGFSRSMSNKGRVLIHGQRASVVGVINMNMMLVDVTHVENVKKGDEVVLIGQQGENEISVASFGEISEQVNYELLTRLPDFIPRYVVE